MNVQNEKTPHVFWQECPRFRELNKVYVVARFFFGGTSLGFISGSVISFFMNLVCYHIPSCPKQILSISTCIASVIGGGLIGVKYASFYLNYLVSEGKKAFPKRLEDDETLHDFVCPITRTLVHNPVRTPQGQIYERRAITRWILLQGTDPLTRQSLCVQDLKEDREVMRCISKRITELVNTAPHPLREALQEIFLLRKDGFAF